MRTPELAEQFESLDKQAHAARLGMWAFLGSEALLFAGLFALYAAYRSMYRSDFIAAVRHNNLTLGTVNTYVLITSSLTVALAVHAVRDDRPRRAAWLLWGSVALGGAFLALKGIEYAEHLEHGLLPGLRYAARPATFGAQLFFSLYWLMTGLHALHVVVGMALLAWLAVRVAAGAFSSAHHTALELGGLYWHLVDVIWIFLWPLLYLAR